jgi:hypothetical protein
MQQRPSNHGNPLKKALLSMTLVAIHLAAFAQGKVIFGNDAGHLVVFTGSLFDLPVEYRPYAGQPVPQLSAPGDQFQYFTAELYAGRSPTGLTLQSTLRPPGLAGLPDGWIGNQPVTLSDVPAGTAFFQILIWETAYTNFTNAVWNGRPVGTTPIFEATAGEFAPTPLVTSPGWVGPIEVVPVPEPSIFVLAGLGVVSLLIFRRRK